MITYQTDGVKMPTFSKRRINVWIREVAKKYNFKVDHSNPEYFMNDIQEYFAQAYSEYLTNPKRLKKHCPKTYEFIRYHIDGQYVEVEAM